MTVKALLAAAKFIYTLPDPTDRGFGGKTTLYKSINEGKLRAKKQGNRTIVLHDDAIEYAKSLPDYIPRADADEDGEHAESAPEQVAGNHNGPGRDGLAEDGARARETATAP